MLCRNKNQGKIELSAIRNASYFTINLIKQIPQDEIPRNLLAVPETTSSATLSHVEGATSRRIMTVPPVEAVAGLRCERGSERRGF